MNEFMLIALTLTLSDVLLVLAVILLSAGVVMEFGKPTSGLAFSYMGLWCAWKADRLAVSSDALLFWAVAVLLLFVIGRMQGVRQEFPRLCRRFVAGGALAGMAVGLLLGHPGIVSGSAVGAVLGAVAWLRTRQGVAWPGTLLTVLTRVGLPAVVVMSITGLALLAFLALRSMA